MIDPAFKNINGLFSLSIKSGDSDPTINYYMPLAEIKDFNTLMENKPFFWSNKTNKKHIKNLLKCQQMIIKQPKTY